MSFAELTRGRRLRLTGAIAIAVIVVLVVAWLAVHFSTTSNKDHAEEQLIRQAVSDSGIAAEYNLLKVAERRPGFSLDISLRKDAPAESTGELLYTLYGEMESVSQVSLGFTATHRLTTSKLERTTEQWSDLVGHVATAGPIVASFSQVGPTGAATYWLDLKTYSEDPAAEYERIHALERPDWLTHGNLELTTSPNSWPALRISAGRDVTPDELSTFRALNRELAVTVKEGEHYELQMLVELGAQSAEFEMRIITEPLNHESTTSPSTTPEDDSRGEFENQTHSDDAADDSTPKTDGSGTEDTNSTNKDSADKNTDPQDSQNGNPGGNPPADPATPVTPNEPPMTPAPAPAPAPEATDPPQPNPPSIVIPDTGANTDTGQMPPMTVRPQETPNGVAPTDPSARIETIASTLSTQSELILEESGLSAFVVTIQVDDHEPIVVRP